MCKSDNLTTFTRRLSGNLGASTSWKSQGLFRPVQGLLYLLLCINETAFEILSWIKVTYDRMQHQAPVNNAKSFSSPVTGLEWPKGFQGVKVPRVHHNGTGWS